MGFPFVIGPDKMKNFYISIQAKVTKKGKRVERRGKEGRRRGMSVFELRNSVYN